MLSGTNLAMTGVEGTTLVGNPQKTEQRGCE